MCVCGFFFFCTLRFLALNAVAVAVPVAIITTCSAIALLLSHYLFLLIRPYLPPRMLISPSTFYIYTLLTTTGDKIAANLTRKTTGLPTLVSFEVVAAAAAAVVIIKTRYIIAKQWHRE